MNTYRVLDTSRSAATVGRTREQVKGSSWGCRKYQRVGCAQRGAAATAAEPLDTIAGSKGLRIYRNVANVV